MYCKTKEGGEIAMTTAEKLREEGWQKGREEASYSMLKSKVSLTILLQP